MEEIEEMEEIGAILSYQQTGSNRMDKSSEDQRVIFFSAEDQSNKRVIKTSEDEANDCISACMAVICCPLFCACLPLVLMQEFCCPDDETEENDFGGQKQNHEEHILSQLKSFQKSQYIRPDIYMNRMPEKPSELTKQEEDLIFQALDKEFDAYISDLDPDTMTHEEKDSNKNAFIEVFFNGGPVAFPDGMDYVVCNEHTMLSWYQRRRSTNETPYLQEVGRNSVDSVPEYVGEIDEFRSAPNNIATIVNESKVTYTTQVTDQPSLITSGQEKLATAYALSTSKSDDYNSRNPDPYSDYSSRNPDPYGASNTYV